MEQRRREDAAPHLRDVVPGLKSVRLRVEDHPVAGRTAAWPYTRHIIVETAPALFTVRCTEPRCDGRHDLTAQILRDLRETIRASEGESACQGNIGDAACDRILHYSCEAEFR